ncbi:MAG: propionyl-CoA synthetase [Rhodospirillaceae bacterium]|nr:propionyl-CoA synthetase [Rhodospirillaceae bacterium]
MPETSRYDQVYRSWREAPEAFWAEAAKAIHWHTPYTQVLDVSRPPFARWFLGGEVNTCYNALDLHVDQGHGARAALIYDSPLAGVVKRYTYAELRDATARVAGMLAAEGIGKGDRVIIYMPMVPEAVMAMLACARIGAIHSVVFGGFAARELAVRIDDAKPKLILSASCGLEPGRVVAYKPLLDKALELAAHKVGRCIILQRDQGRCDLTAGRDRDWHDSFATAKPAACVPVASTDPAYILYTSGTTGIPKGVVRDTAGHIVALKWSMANVYGAQPGETYWAASDIGWVVGHSYIVYGPLFQGCTTILYEGKPVGTPDAGAFWRVVRDHKVRTLFTAPTAFRAIKRDDPDALHLKKYDVSCLRALFLAGERADPDTIKWAESHLRIPVIDHWWQTETGWAIAANPLGLGLLPVKHGSPGKAMPGYDVRVVDPAGQELPAGTSGAIVVKLPLPPSCLPTLWHNDAGFTKSYLADYPGCYKTGDAGHVDADGYLYVMGRTDDIINVAGHRLSTGEMEEVLSGHPNVAECAVIGVADAIKGAVPMGLVVLKSGVARPPAEITAELIAKVREDIGPVASFKSCLIVARLPKTRSGKVLRGTMRRIADGVAYDIPPTIDDPVVLDEIASAMGKAKV